LWYICANSVSERVRVWYRQQSFTELEGRPPFAVKEIIMEEIWQPIINFEDTYEISNYGKVRSIDRTVACVYGTRIITKDYKGKELRLFIRNNYDNYTGVRLRKDGRYYQFCMHLLVWDNFIRVSRDRMHIIQHADGDRTNNRLDNLELIPKRWGIHNPTQTNPYRGVIRVQRRLGFKWSARLRHDGMTENLGTYDEPEEAHVVYQTRLREVEDGSKSIDSE